MNLAYLILAHGQPDHLQRLISALREDWTRFYVHIDTKADMRPFEPLRALPQTVLIDDRVDACWGGYSLVQATLNLMAAALRDTPAPDWLLLLSGADYPIRSNLEIRRYLENSPSEHISLMKMPTPDGRKPLNRLERYHFEGARGRPKAKRVLLTQTNRLLEKFYKRNYRPILGDMTPYASSQWWALSRDAVRYILDFVATHRRFVDFYKRSLIPDEMFFHTILGNSPFRERTARNLTYADWTRGLSRNPAALTAAHIDQFADPAFQLDDVEGIGPCFFARKFTSKDGTLLDRLDALRAGAEAATGDAPTTQPAKLSIEPQ